MNIFLTRKQKQSSWYAD